MQLPKPILVPVALAGLLACHHAAGPMPAPLSLRLGTGQFTLKTPRTAAQEEQGLMGVHQIPDDGGMLFDQRDKREHPTPAMWMKNCPIPMDMVFVSPQGRITKILTATAEPRAKQDQDYPIYTPLGVMPYAGLAEAMKRMPATDWVIELRAGRAQEVGLAEGGSIPVLPGLTWVKIGEKRADVLQADVQGTDQHAKVR